MRVASVKKVNGYPEFRETKCWHDSNLDPNIIDFDDKAVYENVYHKATTRNAGVFQLTSGGAQKLFERAKPGSITDIAALTSIYRPGPLAAGVDKIYVEAKANPHEIRYEHPLVKQVLQDSYGTIIFQESLMELCHVVAGFPKPECDKVRKNVLKRQAGNKEEAAKKAKAMRDDFVNGAVKNGLAEKTANDLWDKILFFSGYGFNKTCSQDTEIDIYSMRGEFLCTKQIKDVESGEYVRSRDESSGEDVFVEVVVRHDHGVLDLVEVTLDTGDTVKCTMDHKFRTTCGKMLPLKTILEKGMSIVMEKKEKK